MADIQKGFFEKSWSEIFDFDLSSLTWTNLFTSLASTGIIFGGVIPYVPQYMEIYKTENADGFSIYVCFVLLLANTLRIVFWFGHPFELPLLFQSIIMIFTMLALVELCVRTKNRNLIAGNKKNLLFFDSSDESRECLTAPYHVKLVSKQFYDLKLQDFWQWTDFVSYLECMATISLISGVLMYFLINNIIFVQTIGFIALITEAGLGLPQLYRNHVNKSTVGMNRIMVLLWLAGDFFKTIYYIVRDSPKQFWVCGFIQITIDVLILMQGFFFKGQKKYKRIDKDYK